MIARGNDKPGSTVLEMLLQKNRRSPNVRPPTRVSFRPIHSAKLVELANFRQHVANSTELRSSGKSRHRRYLLSSDYYPRDCKVHYKEYVSANIKTYIFFGGKKIYICFTHKKSTLGRALAE